MKTLKINKPVNIDMIIREIELEDALLFNAFLRQLDNETDYMLFEPGERKEITSETKNHIKKILENESFMIIAETKGKIVAYASAERGYVRRIKHTAYIVIGILKEYQRKGIGTHFMNQIDNWAKKSGVHRLELTVIDRNITAINLYTNQGFTIEGIRKDAVMLNDNYSNELYMCKLI